jgi:hypothetical protein
MMHPDPRVELHNGIHVVRDDLIPGGTKRRFVDGFIAEPHDEFVYASPAFGGAQIALACAARAAGKRATIFVAKRKELHPRTAEAQAAGAKVIEIPHGYLSNVQSKATAYCAESGARLLPHGFDTPEALAAIAAAATIVRRKHGTFDEVWSVVGSGVLTRGLQLSALGRAYVGVAVGRESPAAGSARIIVHDQPFGSDARQPPPFPSCSNYDAKAWTHLIVRKSTASPRTRILFWNVMG